MTIKVDNLTVAVREDLEKYLINKGNPGGKDRNEYSSSWYAGGQIGALKFYLGNGAEVINEWMDDDYQGSCYAIIKTPNTFVLWRDSFGCCSGCDDLEDQNGYEYIKDTLQEGNTRQFNTLKDMKKYIEQTNDFWRKQHPFDLKEMIDKSKELPGNQPQTEGSQ